MVPDAGGLRMIRFAAAASAAATCLLLATSSGPVAAPDSRALPMQFDVWTEGPAQACGNDCRTWVSASGAITGDTPKDFDAFAKKNKIDGATIALDSDGGSVLGALALASVAGDLECGRARSSSPRLIANRCVHSCCWQASSAASRLRRA